MTRTAVCFDLDDTLYDYHEYARAGLHAAADLVHRRSGKRVQDDLLSAYFDPSVDAGTFDVLLDEYDLPSLTVDDLVDAFHAAGGRLDPYPETERVLDALGTQHALGLVTDGRGGQSKLDRLGIREHFDAVLVTHDVGRSKHERGVFEDFLADLDVHPTRATYVGDDPRVDFRAPNELGMTTVRLRRGRYVDLEPEDAAAAPDYEIATLDGLLSAVPTLHVEHGIVE
ncbi:HAD family hydrolase [Halorubellus sp. PRR65]|uniref:HAD family hydrolase n=1 Tax=Halorubellus sp. PRR65 TaxID=3098148 RepID=UPI002B259929|nr:HAD family hydrolase [Halorubellus sp. PRR65]